MPGGGKPVPVVPGEGTPEVPGSGNPAASPGNKGPPVGATDPADSPGSTGGQKPPPVGSGQTSDSGSTGAKKPPPVGSGQSSDPADSHGSPGEQKPPPVGSPQSSDSGTDLGLSQADVLFQRMITASDKPINAQNRAIADKANDKPTVDWSSKYKADENKDAELGELAYRESLFSYLKLEETTQYRHIKLNSKIKAVTDEARPKPANEALYSKEDKVIIAKNSWAKFDGSKDRLTWNQLVFKNWKDVAGSDVGKLKWIVRDTINNWDTLSVINKALSKAGKDPDKPFSHEQVGVFEPSDESFKALAGTDNGKGPFYMLANYHKELGDLKVVRIHTWGDDGVYFIVLELGH